MHWKKAGIILLLLLFPMALSLLGRRLLTDDPEVLQRRDMEEKMRTAMGELDSRKDFAEHFARRFRIIEQRVFAASDPFATWKRQKQALLASYPSAIQAILLDGQGRVVAEDTDRPVSRQMMQRFFLAYSRFCSEGAPLGPAELGFVKSFFGPFFPAEKEFHRQFLFSSADPHRSYVYLSAPSRKGMLILFFRTNEQPDLPALKEVAADVQHRYRGLELRIIAAERPPTPDDLPLPRAAAIASSAWNLVCDSATGSVWLGDVLFTRQILSPAWMAVGSMKLSRVGAKSRRHGREALGWLCVAGGCLLLAWFLEPVFAGSVRCKLLGTFVYTSLLPLLIMGFAARQFLGERRMALERERHQEIEQGLMRLDRRYSREIGRLNHAFAEQYASASRFLIPDENCLKQKLPEMARRWGFDFCTVFGVKGEQQVSFRATEGRTTSPKLLQYLGKISAEAMRRSVSGEQSDLSEQRDLGKLEFIGLLPTVKGIDWGASKNIVGFFPLGQAVGRVTHLVVGLWDPARMQLDFLRRHAERESRMLGDGRLLIWCPQNPEIAFPESLARLRQLAALRPKVNNRAISYRSRMSLGGTSYLVTGVRFQQLNKFACLRLTPDHSIQFQIHDLTMKFWFIVVLISSLCALVGVVLADMILIPVRDLTSGLDALSRRDFRARIPVHHGDELGQAARLLNETAEGLQDLELAKTLQEAFFPTKPLLLGDLRIWGQSCFAGKVGGDYVDFFALDDHRGLFMIADVSGHGVAASLVVAMARAAFRHPAVGDDPMQLMQTLNALLLSVLRKKKMMTCCLGLFDVREHHVRLVNAGHPWPLHLHAGGAEFLKSIGMPLGSAKRWKAGEVACPLEPGDVVFCYSDGLVEARSGNGPIGFTRLSESAPSFVGSNAETTAALFWQWFAREAPESPPADDVSILILQRLLPEQGESS